MTAIYGENQCFCSRKICTIALLCIVDLDEDRLISTPRKASWSNCVHRHRAKFHREGKNCVEYGQCELGVIRATYQRRTYSDSPLMQTNRHKPYIRQFTCSCWIQTSEQLNVSYPPLPYTRSRSNVNFQFQIENSSCTLVHCQRFILPVFQPQNHSQYKFHVEKWPGKINNVWRILH